RVRGVLEVVRHPAIAFRVQQSLQHSPLHLAGAVPLEEIDAKVSAISVACCDDVLLSRGGQVARIIKENDRAPFRTERSQGADLSNVLEGLHLVLAKLLRREPGREELELDNDVRPDRWPKFTERGLRRQESPDLFGNAVCTLLKGEPPTLLGINAFADHQVVLLVAAGTKEAGVEFDAARVSIELHEDGGVCVAGDIGFEEGGELPRVIRLAHRIELTFDKRPEVVTRPDPIRTR